MAPAAVNKSLSWDHKRIRSFFTISKKVVLVLEQASIKQAYESNHEGDTEIDSNVHLAASPFSFLRFSLLAAGRTEPVC